MAVSLLNLDSNKHINIEESEPLIIGRGDVTGCLDKRVSRKHLKLTIVEDGKLHLVALHSNPCFFMKGGLPPVGQIKKNEDKILIDGDYVALLPDTFWYQIVGSKKIKETKLVTTKETQSEKTPQKLNKSSTAVESPKSDVDLPAASTSLLSLSPGSSPVQLARTSPHPSALPSGDTTPDLSPTLLPVPLIESAKKTPVRKLPLWMYEIDEPSGAKATPSSKNKNKRPGSGSYSTPEEVKKQKISDGGSSEKNEVRVKTEPDSEPGRVGLPTPNPVDGAVVSINTDVPAATVEIETEAIVKPDPDQVDEEKVKKSDEMSKEAGTSKGKTEKEGYESDVGEPESPGTATAGNAQSGSGSSANRRPLCQYEASCYRKNPQHKADFCHPGDADYMQPQDRPVCAYGAACYRRNVMHRVEYQHPAGSSGAPPPNTSPPPVTLPPKRKRKKAQYTDETESDEYDLDDPFLNDDSEDDFVPTDSEEEDESQSQSQSQEDLKRLKKESKRFIDG